jgi:hypothetical protein
MSWLDEAEQKRQEVQRQKLEAQQQRQREQLEAQERSLQAARAFNITMESTLREFAEKFILTRKAKHLLGVRDHGRHYLFSTQEDLSAYSAAITWSIESGFYWRDIYNTQMPYATGSFLSVTFAPKEQDQLQIDITPPRVLHRVSQEWYSSRNYEFCSQYRPGNTAWNKGFTARGRSFVSTTESAIDDVRTAIADMIAKVELNYFECIKGEWFTDVRMYMMEGKKFVAADVRSINLGAAFANVTYQVY